MSAATLNEKRLSTYLNDRLAVVTGGVELAKRSLGSNKGTPYEDLLVRLASELDEDRSLLRAAMQRLGVNESQVKAAAGWIGEKVGRLKLNDSLVGYSPLSRVVELEGLHTILTLMHAAFSSLDRVLGDDPRLHDIDLALAAGRQAERLGELEGLRLRALEQALLDG